MDIVTRFGCRADGAAVQDKPAGCGKIDRPGIAVVGKVASGIATVPIAGECGISAVVAVGGTQNGVVYPCLLIQGNLKVAILPGCFDFLDSAEVGCGVLGTAGGVHRRAPKACRTCAVEGSIGLKHQQIIMRDGDGGG